MNKRFSICNCCDDMWHVEIDRGRVKLFREIQKALKKEYGVGYKTTKLYQRINEIFWEVG